MALSNRINFRGGQSQPLGKYLYKEGVDNVALTGGLSDSGYTFHTSVPMTGSLTFESSDILMTLAPSNNSCALCGTTSLVDLGNINTVILKYTENGVSKQMTLDVSNKTDLRYIYVALYRTSSACYVDLGVSITKTTVQQSTGILYTEKATVSSVKIDEIQYT